jgi:hypothetical protein
MTDPIPAEPTKVTRARATTSDVPRRAPRTKAIVDPPPPVPVIEELVRADKVEIHQGGANNVEADAVTVTQGGLTNVNARTVDVRMGGIAYAQAEDVTVNMGGVGLARADRVSVELGGLGVAFAREATVSQGFARNVLAQDVRVDQALVGTMVTARASFERPSGVLMLIAGRVDGPVKALLDWRSALAFGAAFGVAWGILRRR